LRIWQDATHDITAQQLEEGAARARMFIGSAGSYVGYLEAPWVAIKRNGTNYKLNYYDQGSGIFYMGFDTGDAGGGGGTGDSCFPAKTQILMANGNIKNIVDIKVGDYVLTKTSETFSKLTKARVLKFYEHPETNDFLMINDVFRLTPNHRIFINKAWQRAENLKIGDILLDYNNNEITIKSIKIQNWKAEKVYNLEIEKYRTYFADGFYVHNAKTTG